MGASEFKLEFLKSLSSLIIAAFGLVAALAWNETIKTAVARVFDSGNDLLGMLIYALIVTILAVAATMLITRATNKQKKRIEDEQAKKEAKKAGKTE
ncbi:MAG: DUF5654 family protein [Methanomethylophilus sp.]